MFQFQIDAGFRHIFERLFPRRRHKSSVPAHERLSDAIRMRTDVIAEKSARAQIAVVPARPIFRIDLDGLIRLRLNGNAAPVAAIGADPYRRA